VSAASTAGEAARSRAEDLADAARPVLHSAAERAGEVASTAEKAARSRAAQVADAARPALTAAAERAGGVASTAGEVARARAADAAARLAAPPQPQLVDASHARTVQVPGDPDHPAPIIVNLS
jgi:hypothetical protein